MRKKLEKYVTVEDLVDDLKETLDTVALEMQHKIKEVCMGYDVKDEKGRRVGVPYGSDGQKAASGISYMLERINHHFGTHYETGISKIALNDSKPVIKTKD